MSTHTVKLRGFKPTGPVHIIRPAKPSIRTLEFPSYNEALSFARKSASLNPSKPYKRIKGASAPLWAVSMVDPFAIKARADSVRFDMVPGFTGMFPSLSALAQSAD